MFITFLSFFLIKLSLPIAKGKTDAWLFSAAGVHDWDPIKQRIS
jgi:hypothetical protein